MSKVFTFPKKIPQYLGEVPLYRVSKYKTYSPRIEEVKVEFDARVKRYKEIFRINGKSEDYGTQVVFKDGSKVLEVYRPSDSFWWTDLEVAYREDVPEGAKLPDEKEAKEIALRYMKELNLEPKYARVVSITRTTTAISEAEKKERRKLLDTEVHVNFSFSIDDYPVMGPGAKIKISMVEGGRIGNFLWFWREPFRERGVKTIHPEEALNRLTRDQRFAYLSPDKTRISLEEIKFGYYAVAPFNFQRFLIPVYKIRGTIETELLGRRDLIIYTPAMELTPETIKKMGFVDQPDINRILPSTK